MQDSDTFRIRVEHLRILPNIPAGMDFGVIGGLLKKLRTTSEDWEPIIVQAVDDGTFIVKDGRHRFFANVIAGRPDVLAKLE